EFLHQTKEPIETPEVSKDWRGDRDNFANGRHRWAFLRDKGAKTIPVSVPKEHVAWFKERYGSGNIQASFNESDHPRDEHGRFAWGGGESLPNKFDLIHGHSAVALVQKLARAGFTKDQIRNVFKSYGLDVSEGSISKNMRMGLRGQLTGNQTPLTEEQLADL